MDTAKEERVLVYIANSDTPGFKRVFVSDYLGNLIYISNGTHFKNDDKKLKELTERGEIEISQLKKDSRALEEVVRHKIVSRIKMTKSDYLALHKERMCAVQKNWEIERTAQSISRRDLDKCEKISDSTKEEMKKIRKQKVEPIPLHEMLLTYNQTNPLRYELDLDYQI